MISRITPIVTKVYDLLNRFEGIPILIVRIVLGVMFAQSGYGKLFKNHEGVVTFFTTLGIPFPALNAWFVSGVEFFGGLCLIVGLGTRIFALMLSFTMLIATLTSILPDLKKDNKYGNISDLFFIPEVLTLLLLVWMVFSGPGFLSIDHLLRKKLAPPPPK
ncbi:MAG TPA: DoxX family protein [Planctomycetota bacterium]|nr:DoxX family protein [Planctomycetota bacterium]